MPGGAAVPRIAVLFPAHPHAGRRVLTFPSSAAYGNKSTGDTPGRTVLVRWYRGKLVGQGDHPPGAVSRGVSGAGPHACPAPARRTMSSSRPARSTRLAQPAAVSPG